MAIRHDQHFRWLADVIHDTRDHHGEAREHEKVGPVAHDTKEQNIGDDPKRKGSPMKK